VWAAEVETAAPFAASLAAGRRARGHAELCGRHRRQSVLEGCGRSRDLLSGSIVVSLVRSPTRSGSSPSAAASRAEGAGAASVAAALTGKTGGGSWC
jgi:hypothetical protein